MILEIDYGFAPRMTDVRIGASLTTLRSLFLLRHQKYPKQKRIYKYRAVVDLGMIFMAVVITFHFGKVPADEVEELLEEGRRRLSDSFAESIRTSSIPPGMVEDVERTLCMNASDEIALDALLGHAVPHVRVRTMPPTIHSERN
jgi:hypothetical protein